MVTGNVWIFLAGFGLPLPAKSTAAVGLLVGAALVVAAATEAAVSRTTSGGWRALQNGLAGLFAAGAAAASARPAHSLGLLTSELGALLIAPGGFYMVRAVALRKQTPYRSTGLISGTLVAQFGVWDCASGRVEGLASRTAFVCHGSGSERPSEGSRT